jgi:hypothetical protein
MAEENVLDAVNAALGDGAEAPEPETEEVEAPEGEETETPEADGESEGEAEGETEGEKPEGEEEAEGEPEKGPNGERERNPDGTWKKPESKKDEPKAKDPVNDPIPRDTKKETSERIRSLIDTTKAVTAERDEIKQNFDYLIKGVQDTGTTPAQYGEALSWLALFNSNNPQQQEKALELVESVAERLAMLLGKERTVGDALSAHADLKDAVAKGQITAQYAKEIARTRNGAQFRGELSTQATAAAQQQQQAANEEAQGRQSLSELETTLMASDPDYAQKKAILVPALKPIMGSIPWSQKKDKFLAAYKNLRLPNAAPAKPKGAPANQPMRAKQPAGGQSKAPGNMLDAINGALAGMGK